MNLWKSFERLLPAALRRSAPEMPHPDYLVHFAQLADDAPAWRAVMEFGRYRFALYAQVSSDTTRPDAERFEAFQRALQQAEFLNKLEEEREFARTKFQQLQRAP